MVASIDGRIVTDGWPLSDVEREQYELLHEAYNPEGWLCGRVTMERHFAQHSRSAVEIVRQHDGPPREDFVAPGEHEAFAFALDSHGRLAWASSDIEGDHVVAILSERVSDEYLTFLRDRGVSYVLAGKREVDLAVALEKIASLFDVRTLMLEGGGRINGSMLRAGLIDEVSLLVAPVADGRIGSPTVFDVDEDGDGTPAWRLALMAVERRNGDMLWLRYRVEATR
jgi:riboflavin biosynthesis pyrimidine reductase